MLFVIAAYLRTIDCILLADSHDNTVGRYIMSYEHQIRAYKPHLGALVLYNMPYVNKSRTAGVPGCYHPATHRKQVENADPAQPAGPSVAVQRDAPLYPRDQPKGADR